MTYNFIIPNLKKNQKRNLYFFSKRLFDIGLCFALMPLVILMISMFYIFVRLESRGGGLFLQERIGYRGEIFVIYKLRSMHVDVKTGIQVITKVGAFMRKHRIDEFPQIFNILKGDMSFVGPRPEVVYTARIYEKMIPGFERRNKVKPGLSGYAQVHQGHVTSVGDVSLKLTYDLYYIEKQSFLLDAKIILQTLCVAATGRGYK